MPAVFSAPECQQCHGPLVAIAGIMRCDFCGMPDVPMGQAFPHDPRPVANVPPLPDQQTIREALRGDEVASAKMAQEATRVLESTAAIKSTTGRRK